MSEFHNTDAWLLTGSIVCVSVQMVVVSGNDADSNPI